MSAVMWAMPVASRTTVTSAERPGTVAVPLVCGKARAVTQTRRPVTARTATSTTTSTTPMARLMMRTDSSSWPATDSTVR